MKALIKQNEPCCPICEGNPVLGAMTGNYGVCKHDGKTYYYFERYCMGNCRDSYIYYADITLNGESKKYSFDNVSEVNEDEDMA